MTNAELINYAIDCVLYWKMRDKLSKNENTPTQEEFVRLIKILDDVEQDFYDIEADKYLKAEKGK